MAEVDPLATLPLIVGNSSDAPSLKTMSPASETCVRFVTLCSWPEVAKTWLQVAFGSAICDVAILFAALIAAARPSPG